MFDDFDTFLDIVLLEEVDIFLLDIVCFSYLSYSYFRFVRTVNTTPFSYNKTTVQTVSVFTFRSHFQRFVSFSNGGI